MNVKNSDPVCVKVIRGRYGMMAVDICKMMEEPEFFDDGVAL